MAATKIPKSFLRPPKKVLATSKVEATTQLLTISENKTSLPMCSNVGNPVPPKHSLRRRSKSVTDLRSISTRHMTLSTKHVPLAAKPFHPAEKMSSAKTGQKRPVGSNSDEAVKPKVAKIKIPDWDYKSRFHELQGRYNLSQEELKKTKNRLSELKNLEEELKILRSGKKYVEEQIESLQNKHAVVTREHELLQVENCKMKNDLHLIKASYETLRKDHDLLIEDNKENLSRLNMLQEGYNGKEAELDMLKQKQDELEMFTQQLQQEVSEQNELRRTLHNTIQDLKGNIRVFCRVRPPVNEQERDRQLCAIFFPDETSLDIRKSRESVSTINGKCMDMKQEFSFDKVFPPEATQTEVFEELSQLIQSALDGFHVCVFAYGQTGSGKTHTMQGTSEDLGMVPRTIDLIFEKIDKTKKTDWNYVVTASFLEIYNENIRDLLVPNSSHNYEVRYNEGRGVTVTNLKIVPINSANELKKLMEEAHKNRAVAATDFNEHSSRSHAVTRLHLQGYNTVTKVTYGGSINLVDLAGSESAKTSSADRLTETKSINKSLSTLGSVMLALHNKDTHVPYRNSKLTFLLQSCLGGNSKTLMFVNISPFEESYGESVNSLRFATKVKDIKTNAKKNKSYNILTPLLQSSKSTL